MDIRLSEPTLAPVTQTWAASMAGRAGSRLEALLVMTRVKASCIL